MYLCQLGLLSSKTLSIVGSTHSMPMNSMTHGSTRVGLELHDKISQGMINGTEN